LWHFQKKNYHKWVLAEQLHTKFPPVYSSDKITNLPGKNTIAGIGLHDSSSALIPYLKLFNEPFILLSTGTWSISLNPFNSFMLSDYELHNDCLCYLSYQGKPVKASRLFAGYEHEVQIKRLADHFNTDESRYKTVAFNNAILKKLGKRSIIKVITTSTAMVQQSAFGNRPLQNFETYDEAYHQLMLDIIAQQVFSTKLVLNNTHVKKIFVDGGFGKNDVYMHLLAAAFPDIKVYAASIPQASSLGAALVLHDHLNNTTEIPNLINLKYYPAKNKLAV
jgi:L-fuculokinase